MCSVRMRLLYHLHIIFVFSVEVRIFLKRLCKIHLWNTIYSVLCMFNVIIIYLHSIREHFKFSQQQILSLCFRAM
jgi:hypothetical protein